ncbi:MAG: hypothetical protein COY82_02005 [Parcubacteria group bacterium CG_4_10_14_0_8_um_filter_35_7]|nr:MAG: hypothetical protein COX43_00095 [Parcubacteria group bacterium CG23_combo_of_CG06-09_8_20_14_all_35_9]PIY78525.1 MAG: hypothetical protein COY82_02005 [Parcubacteria group bacterium CG_4_10_14_0_8_um_filter_35_7]
MKKRQFAVIGLGNFGLKVAETLAQEGAFVLAIDKDEALIEKIRDVVTEAIQLDSTDEEALRASGVGDMDVVVVGMGSNTEVSILTVALLKEMGIKEIIVRANSNLHARILRTIGVKRVILPEEDMGVRVAKGILIFSLREYVELGGEYGLIEMEVKEESVLIDKTLSELDLRAKHHINVILIKRITREAIEGEEEETRVTREFPTAEYRVRAGDILVVVGETKAIQNFEKICVQEIKE